MSCIHRFSCFLGHLALSVSLDAAETMLQYISVILPYVVQQCESLGLHGLHAIAAQMNETDVTDVSVAAPAMKRLRAVKFRVQVSHPSSNER